MGKFTICIYTNASEKLGANSNLCRVVNVSALSFGAPAKPGVEKAVLLLLSFCISQCVETPLYLFTSQDAYQFLWIPYQLVAFVDPHISGEREAKFIKRIKNGRVLKTLSVWNQTSYER